MWHSNWVPRGDDAGFEMTWMRWFEWMEPFEALEQFVVLLSHFVPLSLRSFL